MPRRRLPAGRYCSLALNIAIFAICYATMQYEQLKTGRLRAGLTQKLAAERLGVSQPYLSQLEKGERPVTAELALSAIALYRLPATALPLPETLGEESKADDALLARQLSGLGYPDFAHLRPRKANPAAVVLTALLRENLETRLAEALPWVLLTYLDLDWSWLIHHAKLQDVQNRVGFLVGVATYGVPIDIAHRLWGRYFRGGWGHFWDSWRMTSRDIT